MSENRRILDRLLAAAPNWAALQKRADCKADLIASPLRTSQTPTRTFSLVIEAKHESISVREQPEGRLLPFYCPQRHLNNDGSFCLGLDAGRNLNEKNARAWWDKLLVFLTGQETAAEIGAWPKELELSHGEAGPTEILAENEAEKLGLLTEYQKAVREDTGYVANALGRFNAKTSRIRNARAACICGRKNKKGRPKLRRDCHADKDACLIVLELERRRQQESFWRIIKETAKCCGTMNDCPLRGSPASK